jgi:hypothetical protein
MKWRRKLHSRLAEAGGRRPVQRKPPKLGMKWRRKLHSRLAEAG